MFKVNRVTIYRWIKEGKLDAYGIGKHFKIPAKEVRRLAGEFGISGELLEEIQSRLEGIEAPAGEEKDIPSPRNGTLVAAVTADRSFRAFLEEVLCDSGSDGERQMAGGSRRFRLAVFPDSLTAALEMGREKPGLIILDGATPGLDGVDLADKIKSIYRAVKVVFIAAEPVRYSPEYLKSLVRAGVMVVGRPLGRDVFRAILQEVPSGGKAED